MYKQGNTRTGKKTRNIEYIKKNWHDEVSGSYFSWKPSSCRLEYFFSCFQNWQHSLLPRLLIYKLTLHFLDGANQARQQEGERESPAKPSGEETRDRKMMNWVSNTSLERQSAKGSRSRRRWEWTVDPNPNQSHESDLYSKASCSWHAELLIEISNMGKSWRERGRNGKKKEKRTYDRDNAEWRGADGWRQGNGIGTLRRAKTIWSLVDVVGGFRGLCWVGHDRTNARRASSKVCKYICRLFEPLRLFPSPRFPTSSIIYAATYDLLLFFLTQSGRSEGGKIIDVKTEKTVRELRGYIDVNR